MNILITGAAGTLGTELVKICCDRGYTPIALCHSEEKAQTLKKKFPDVLIYCSDITKQSQLETIFSKHSIDYVIHSAAMKHVGLCQQNPSMAIDTNIVGSKNLIFMSKKYKIKNLVAVSTDKAINPSCVYGYTKLLMEHIVLENEYTVIQGVNFLFSSGSVLYLWDKCLQEDKPILVNADNSVRYFVETSTMAKTILDNIQTKDSYIRLNDCYQVMLHDLAKAFGEYHSYNHFGEYESLLEEKIAEEPPENISIIETDIPTLKQIIKRYYNGD
jgi:FlaA1/EpsC-like NDP-sugar epimerase